MSDKDLEDFLIWQSEQDTKQLEDEEIEEEPCDDRYHTSLDHGLLGTK